jgi:lysophospholipase L1-like esterase
MTRIFKKLSVILLAVFLLISILNLVLGLFFSIWNRNKNHLGAAYTDAPYVYYQQENKTGFAIDASLPFTKDTGEYRILLLGGSVAFGLGNLKDSAGKNYLTTLLSNIAPSKKIVLLNGALPAYVSQQEFIALQMHLRKYDPDMVVALHGFNDVESFRVNHNADDVKFIPSPIFYSGDEFSPALKAVESYKKTYTLNGVADGYYRYIRKSANYVGKAANISKYAYEDYSKVTTESITKYAVAFKTVVGDLKNFCEANKITYVDFLQPIRFYKHSDTTYYTTDKTKVANPFLSQLYYKMELMTDSIVGHHSLTGLDPSFLNYIDECHPNEKGYQFLAEEICRRIQKEISK